jgi:ferritin-like metal-binding protein YciE
MLILKSIFFTGFFTGGIHMNNNGNTSAGMGLHSNSQGFDKAFLEQLQDVYDAETQLLTALPKMQQAASSQKLKQIFQQHLQVTERQRQRLEQVFQAIGQPAEAKTCPAMRGLIKEAEEIMQKQGQDPEVLDAALIGAAQKVEHYEIATYGTLRTWAQVLGHQQAITALEATLEEEKQADQLLTSAAEHNINQRAAES